MAMHGAPFARELNRFHGRAVLPHIDLEPVAAEWVVAFGLLRVRIEHALVAGALVVAQDDLLVKVFEVVHRQRLRACGEVAAIPGTGLEPAHLTALDPKSSVSTNSTIRAFREV